MTQKDQVFVANVVVIDPMWKTVVSSVINRPRGAIVELNAIVKIRKYKGLHEGHHFILMAMEVHNTPRHDMDHFIKECALFSTIDDQEVIYPCLFAFNFLSNLLVLPFNVLQCALVSTIERKIALASDACSRLPIIIKFLDLHASDIKGAVGKIATYHEKD
jgi:hypothetical protein